jgi:hypothetical protein
VETPEFLVKWREDLHKELRICFSSYVDILGYKDRILKCQNDYDALNQELQDFKKKILDHQSFLVSVIESRGTVSFFSDSVYIHVPIASSDAKALEDGRPEICGSIENLAMFQFNLALENVYIRGGAAVNFGYLDKTIAFGPGLLDAVECEKTAEYPRICLTELAVEIIKYYIENKWPGDEKINKFILCDNQEKYFINYLQTIIDFVEDMCDNLPDDYKRWPLYRNVPEAVDQMRKHKENIELNLRSATESKVLNKFEWLAQYHNFFCRKHFREMTDLIIPNYENEFLDISDNLKTK